MADSLPSPYDSLAANTEANRLAALRTYSIIDTPDEIEFDRLVRLAAEICDTPMAAISILDDRRLWFKAVWGLSMREMDLSMAFCKHGIRQDGFYQVPDASVDPLFRDNPTVTGSPGLRFYAGYPLRTQGGYALGMLAVLDTQPRALTPRQREQLQTLGMLAMVTLELRRRQLMLREVLGEHAQRHAVLQSLTADVARAGYWQLAAGTDAISASDETLALLEWPVGSALSMPALLRQCDPESQAVWQFALAESFSSGVVFDVASAMLIGGRQRYLRWLARPDGDKAGGTVRRLIGIVQDVSEFHEIECSAHRWNERFRLVAQLTSDEIWEWDVARDKLWSGKRLLGLVGHRGGAPGMSEALKLLHPEDRERVAREIGATLTSGAVSWTSTFRLQRDGGSYAWVDNHAQVVRDQNGKVLRVVGCLKDVSAQMQLEAQRRLDEQRIHQLAFYDQLTGLPNRRALMERLQHALAVSRRRHEHGALMFLDLDNFKTFNDAFGHDIGDELLKQVGSRLHRSIRSLDTVARLGGDEFVILLEELGSDPGVAALQAETAAQKILDEFKRPFDLGQTVHDCTSSVGVTLFQGQSESIDDLLKQADLAMYESKQAGRNTVRFFDPHMQWLVTERARLEADLRQAAQRQEFVLHYQPQWTRDGHLAGLEALLRWQHPQRGLVYPDEFISACEETGIVVPIGRWILQHACEQQAAWRAAGLPDVRVSVNVSPRQLRSPDFIEAVRTALAQSGVSPSCLELELTESMLLQDVAASVDKMRTLKQLGVRFSLDDFGTGYSSLSLLQHLPLDQLKIDRSFVHQLGQPNHDSAVVQSIISLGKNMKLRLIAEGIETRAQQQALVALGCDEFQGFLLGSSLPAQEVARLLVH